MAAKRNLDIATLRSFSMIVETGSMTKAAARLHMTQSAISMQIKRLEKSLGLALFERTTQGMKTTAAGEQLLHYAQGMLGLNDEAWNKLTAVEFEGTVTLGLPIDIINPHIPSILREFTRDYPRIQVKLHSANTVELLEHLDEDICDIALTTELNPRQDSIIISRQKLVWTGLIDGSAWHKTPLPIGFCRTCAFRKAALSSLDKKGLSWSSIVEAEDDAAVFATVAADLAITAELEFANHIGREIIQHEGRLPVLPEYSIAMYYVDNPNKHLSEKLGEYIERGFS